MAPIEMLVQRMLISGKPKWLIIAALVLGVGLLVGGEARTQSSQKGHAARDFSRSADPTAIAGSEDIAGSLLVVAREMMSGGREDIAQRALEQLVARYPDSEAATAARRDLLNIYGASFDSRSPASSRPASNAPQSAAGERVAYDPAPVEFRQDGIAGGTSIAPGAAWRTSVTVHRRLQDELRQVVGDRVFFSAGSSELGTRARALIVAQAEWLLARPGVDVVVEGHADDAAAGGDNDAISAGRAATIRDLLLSQGVEADRVRISSKGAGDPIAVCETSDCAAQNRRAVLQVALRRTQPLDNRATALSPLLPASGPQR